MIERQLIVARASLEQSLSLEGIAMPTTSTLLAHAVNLLAAANVAIKPGAVDPRTNYTVDGFSRKDALTSQVDDYIVRADAIIKEYVAIHTSASPFPGMAVVGRRGARIGVYEEMTDTQGGDY